MESALKCDICGNSVWKEKSELLMQCSDCGLIRAKMNPSASQLQEAYGHNYFFGGEYTNYLHDRVALEKNFTMRINNLRKYLNSESTLIEIGCSYGFFLNICKKFIKKCIGYDIAKEGIEYASKEFGLEVYCDSFLNYQGEKVDLVCLWDGKHGFEVVEFKHSTVYRNVDSVFQQLINWKGKKPSVFFILMYRVCRKLGLTKINFGINLFDIMDVVAVKKLAVNSQQTV